MEFWGYLFIKVLKMIDLKFARLYISSFKKQQQQQLNVFSIDLGTLCKKNIATEQVPVIQVLFCVWRMKYIIYYVNFISYM